MKRLVYSLACFLFLIGNTVYAESVTLVWTPSPSQDVVEYRIYQSLIENVFATGAECNAVVVTDNSQECMTKAIVTDLIAGYRYHFIVTAIDNSGNESDPSNMVSITIGPENANPSSSGLGDIQTAIQTTIQ